MNIILNSACSNQSSYQILTSTDNFDFFYQICHKRVFLIKNRKNEHHYSILHARINVGTKFQHKVTILMFWTKFAQNSDLHSNIKKENNVIEFCIFELVQVPNFSIKWQFRCFGPNLPKSSISTQKQKNKIPSVNSACQNQCRYQILASTWNFDFLD